MRSSIDSVPNCSPTFVPAVANQCHKHVQQRPLLLLKTWRRCCSECRDAGLTHSFAQSNAGLDGLSDKDDMDSPELVVDPAAQEHDWHQPTSRLGPAVAYTNGHVEVCCAHSDKASAHSVSCRHVHQLSRFAHHICCLAYVPAACDAQCGCFCASACRPHCKPAAGLQLAPSKCQLAQGLTEALQRSQLQPAGDAGTRLHGQESWINADAPAASPFEVRARPAGRERLPCLQPCSPS